MLGRWARQELSTADGQGPEPQQPLVIFGQCAYVKCATFLSRLSHIARDDALARAREFGFPPPRPR